MAEAAYAEPSAAGASRAIRSCQWKLDVVAPLLSALHETALSPAFVHLIPAALCLLLPLALPRQIVGWPPMREVPIFAGAPGRIRTSDPQIRSLRVRISPKHFWCN